MSTQEGEHVQAVQRLKEAEEAFLAADTERMGRASQGSMDLDPSLGRAWELKGLYLYVSDRVEEARTCFENSLRKRGHFNISRIALDLMGKAQWPEGEGPVERIGRLELLGHALLSDREWPAAALCYITIENRVRPDWRLYSILGLIHREMGTLEPSLKYYDLASGQPDAPEEIEHDRAVVLFKLGRFEEAERSFSRAAEISPSNPMIWNNLGAVQEAQEKDEKALMSYMRSVELEDDYYPALYSLGRLLQKLGRMEESRLFMEKALEIEGRVYDLEDIKGRRKRKKDGSLHVKEVMHDKKS
ncbi:MAG: tetratricopeptide repeat protein [Thermoplasmatota archaeon]